MSVAESPKSLLIFKTTVLFPRRSGATSLETFTLNKAGNAVLLAEKIINMIYVDLGLFRRVHSQCNIQYLFNILSDINYIPR